MNDFHSDVIFFLFMLGHVNDSGVKLKISLIIFKSPCGFYLRLESEEQKLRTNKNFIQDIYVYLYSEESEIRMKMD